MLALARAWAAVSRRCGPSIRSDLVHAHTSCNACTRRWFRVGVPALERAPRPTRTKFVDLVRIQVEGGTGGRGVVSYERTCCYTRARLPIQEFSYGIVVLGARTPAATWACVVGIPIVGSTPHSH